MNPTLEDFVMAHRHLYYTGEACLSDAEYDVLESEALRVLPKNSPLHKHGGPSDAETVKKIARQIQKHKKAQEKKYMELL